MTFILLDGEEKIKNDRILANRFNEHHINIFERSGGFLWNQEIIIF